MESPWINCIIRLCYTGGALTAGVRLYSFESGAGDSLFHLNDFINGPTSPDNLFRCGTVQGGVGDGDVWFSEVEVHTFFNGIKISQLNSVEVSVFEAMEEHFNHGIALKNVYLRDGSDNLVCGNHLIDILIITVKFIPLDTYLLLP